jgi:hypothetical protein
MYKFIENITDEHLNSECLFEFDALSIEKELKRRFIICRIYGVFRSVFFFIFDGAKWKARIAMKIICMKN